MAFFAVNMDSFGISMEDLAVGELEVLGKGTSFLKMNIRDDLIFYREKVRDGATFVCTSTIDSLIFDEGGEPASQDPKASPESEKIIGFKTSQLKTLQPYRILSDFTYSLTVVKKYDNPTKDFQRAMRKLPEDDFKTLSKGDVFWARTAFGTFVNQLPTKSFLEFVGFVSAHDVNGVLESPDYKTLWQQLQDFAVEGFLDAHAYSVAVKELIGELNELDAGIPFESLRIADPDTRMSASLELMTENLIAFKLALDPPNADVAALDSGLFESINLSIEQSREAESRFHRIFRGKPWPLMQKTKI